MQRRRTSKRGHAIMTRRDWYVIDGLLTLPGLQVEAAKPLRGLYQPVRDIETALRETLDNRLAWNRAQRACAGVWSRDPVVP